MILAGDIGGTNTRLCFFEKGEKVGEEKKFSSHQYKSLESVIKEFLKDKKVEKACFGVAGPVRDGKSHVTNLPWIIDAKKISEELSIPSVFLINDLEANAHGIKALKPEELLCVHEGVKQLGNQALIAAGTGLGEAGLFWNGKEHIPFACEGGHADFAPRDDLEIELLRYLQKKFSHVSYERVVSGPGILNLFQFLIDTGKEKWAEEVRLEMDKGNPSRVITEWGIHQKDAACERTLHWFLSLYGSEAGNMALKFLSLGGFFVGGGIAPHLKDEFGKETFYQAFLNKGRFNKLLKTIPIWLVLNDNAALLGAARYAENH